MTNEERQEALRKKAEKKARKGITEPFKEVEVDNSEPLPEEPAIKPRRRRTQAA